VLETVKRETNGTGVGSGGARKVLGRRFVGGIVRFGEDGRLGSFSLSGEGDRASDASPSVLTKRRFPSSPDSFRVGPVDVGSEGRNRKATA